MFNYLDCTNIHIRYHPIELKLYNYRRYYMRTRIFRLLRLIACSPLFRTISKYLTDSLFVKIWNVIVGKKDVKKVIKEVSNTEGFEYTVGMEEDDTYTKQDAPTKEIIGIDIPPKKPKPRKVKPKLINTLDTPGVIATPPKKKRTTKKRTTKKEE